MHVSTRRYISEMQMLLRAQRSTEGHEDITGTCMPWETVSPAHRAREEASTENCCLPDVSPYSLALLGVVSVVSTI